MCASANEPLNKTLFLLMLMWDSTNEPLVTTPYVIILTLEYLSRHCHFPYPTLLYHTSRHCLIPYPTILYNACLMIILIRAFVSQQHVGHNPLRACYKEVPCNDPQ